MKGMLCILAFVIYLSLTGCSNNQAPENEDTVSYTAYEGYSYKGPRPSSDTTLFFQTTDKIGFNSLFFFVSDHNPNPTIPPEHFAVKKVISIVKYGNDYYDLKVKGITLVGTVLKVDYTSTLQSENMTWVAAIPLILALDADYQKIQFVENGKLVKEILL